MKQKDSMFLLQSSTYQECSGQAQTCKFEQVGDSIKVEFIQQRVTKLYFYVKGKSDLKEFRGTEVNPHLNQSDSLKVAYIGTRIDKKMYLEISK